MKKRILIFGGTTEGRELVQKLLEYPVELTLSVATDYGKEVLSNLGDTEVLTGRLSGSQIAQVMQKGSFDLLVDATHPYATEVSANIRWCAQEQKIPLLRLLRTASRVKDCYMAANTSEAVAILANLMEQLEGNILLTTGSKEISAFKGLNLQRLYVRVLPTVDSIQACEALGILHSHILALQGPFTQKMNEAMLEQYHICVMVTKDGGKTGGFEEKLEAAHRAGARVLVIGRPQETQGYCQEDIIEQMKRLAMFDP